MSSRTHSPLRPIFTVLLAAALLTLGLFAALAAPTPALATVGPTTCYVDADSPGPTYNGLSWTTAYTTVQDALASVTCSTIWVAEGVYYPDEGAGQTNNAIASTFALKNGVAIYGGFDPTTGDDTWPERDYTGNVTILSGDLAQNDVNGDGNNIAETWNDKAGPNANTVVSSGASVLSAVLDGFTITAGGNSLGGGHGGIFNGEGSLALANLRLSGKTGDYGGGIGSYKGTISLQDSTISGNYGYYGGGLNIDSGTVVVENVDFIQNQSYAWGSGMYLGGGVVQTTGVLTDVRFIGNHGIPDADGGGLVLSFNPSDRFTATNVLFAGNDAARWGGAVMQYSGTSTFTNITVSGNHAALIGGAFRIWGGSATIQNSIIYGNTAGTFNEFNFNGSPTVTINNSIVNGGCPATAVCSGVTSTDPDFVNPVAAALAPTTTGDYRLQDTSPALNVGNNALNGTSTDLDGDPRIANTIIDLGAYETLFCPDPGGILYVDQDATAGADNGTSWANAFTKLQNALDVSGDCEIWVAEGVYYPDEGAGQTNDDRTSTFALQNGLEIYGGFAATETLRTQRNWTANLTVLSGDLSQDDDNIDANFISEVYTDTTGTNAYHVTTGSGVTTTAVLDGFTITGGLANVIPDWTGGGMYNDSGSPTLTKVTFTGNTATGSGGGMANEVESSPKLTHDTFSGNQAEYGGGIHNFEYSSPALTNFTFSGNQAEYGGGMHNSEYSSPIIQNSILWGNDAPSAGTQVSNQTSSTPTFAYSLVEGLNLGGTNLDGTLAANNPDFVNPINAALAPTTTGDYRLQDGSPALNVGSNAFNSELTDLDGNPRIANTTIDLGAYENQSPLAASEVYLFSSDTGGTVGSVTFADEDVVAWDGAAWSLLFDGSLFGLTPADLDALEMDTDGSLLLSFDIDILIPGFTKVADEDVVRFTPTVPGNYSAGTFSWFLDNSDVALTTTSEDVDALAYRDSKWLMSTNGNFVVTGASGDNKDLMAFNPTTTGSSTSGTFSFFFDGSDILLTLSTEDIDALWNDPATGDLYLSTLGNFAVPSLSGEGRDVFVCVPSTLGLTTACSAFTLFFDGSAEGFPGSVDAFAVK